MAVEVVQFLVKKFVDSFTEEAEAELPFRAQFHAIRAELEKAAVSPANADELQEYLYELNDLLAECRRLANRPNNQRWCFAQSSDAWRFRKTKKRVTAVRRRVLQCSTENASGGNGNAAASQEEDDAAAGLDRWTTPWLERSRIRGFDQQLAEPESKAFRDCGAGTLNGVGIVGMGGIGKTALAQLLFSSPRTQGRFFPRVWMCMSRTASAGADRRKEVLQGMLMALGHEEDAILSIDDGSNSSLAALVIAVHERLKGKRFLIVFDDVWHVDGWYADVVGHQSQSAPRRSDDDWSERLAFALPRERGGLVVVTSRLEQAAEAMVGKSCSYRVRPLADGEICWAIFTDALSKSQEKRTTLDLATVSSMKQEILETCAGLPSAAKTMADIFASSSLSPPASTSTSQELGKSDHIITAS